MVGGAGSVADFRTQGRYQPAASEVKAALPHLLRDLTHIKGELGFDEFVEFAKLTLNSNGGKIVPKLEELKNASITLMRYDGKTQKC